jgi:hypothetical protein
VARSPQEFRPPWTPADRKEKGLVAYWNLRGRTAKDLSGHGNDGQANEKAKAEPAFS